MRILPDSGTERGGGSVISPIEGWIAERTGLGSRLNSKALLEWKLEKVRRLVEYVREHSRFYAERLKGIDPDMLHCFSDLQNIPFTMPADLMQEPRDFVCVPQREVSRIITLNTSGSMGIPKRIYFTGRDLESTVDFFAWGMSTMVRSGQIVLVLMSGRTPYGVGDLLGKGLERIGVSAIIHGNIGNMEAVAEMTQKADCLVGLPGEMIGLCRRYRELRPGSVLLSADYVPESVIGSIEETWDCRVFTHYGMTETGFGGGVQCSAREGYHMRDADLLLEIVDPETGLQVPDGCCGEVTVTTLSREAMPLLRYRTGDMASMISGICPCGGSLPRLGKVVGRRSNIISTSGGGQLSIHQLDEIMYRRPEINNYSARLVYSESKPVLELVVDSSHCKGERELIGYILGSLECDVEIKLSFGNLKPDQGFEKRRIAVE